MAKQTLTNCVTLFDGYDVTGSISATAIEYQAEMLDTTTYGAGATRRMTPGFKTVVAQHEGFTEFGTGAVDPVFYTNVGVTDKPMTMCPTGGAEGELAYTFKAALGQYTPMTAEVGAPLRFSVRGEATSGPLVRATVMQNGTETATGTATARQLGAVTSTQTLYAALHVLTADGTSPSLTVAVRSDDNSGMTTPTTRGTFTAATAIGSEWLEIAGPVTDDYWDLSFTISGTSPSFEFVVVLGIL